jgi:monofunctional biosynthetic peptidoglycan transglycosylase
MGSGRWQRVRRVGSRARARARREPLRTLFFALLLAAALGSVAFAALWVATPDVDALTSQNPRTTALIDQRVREAKARGRTLRPKLSWRKLEEISPRLQWAVILSEDASFYGHDGFDWFELQQAMKRNLEKGGYARGASTLTQQLAKNLYLGTEKSLLRKVKEAVLAAKLERTLTKQRILALYLNVVEWDEGTFGAQAGAQARFGVGAGALSNAQAAVLASMLPAPLKTDLSHPSAWLQQRSFHVLDLMLTAKKLSALEHALARNELTQLFDGSPHDELAPEEPPLEESDAE